MPGEITIAKDKVGAYSHQHNKGICEGGGDQKYAVRSQRRRYCGAKRQQDEKPTPSQGRWRQLVIRFWVHLILSMLSNSMGGVAGFFSQPLPSSQWKTL